MLVLAVACRKEAATPSTAPETSPASAGEAEAPASLDALEGELGRLRHELDVARDDATPTSEADGASTRCARICEISASICGLADSICALADEHPGESRYVRACEGARAECDRSTEACDACSSR